jgi:cyanate lyase
MNRNDVTEKIITTKVSKGITWAEVAKKVGQSKEWTTAPVPGPDDANAEQAKVVGEIFGLTAEEQKWLKVVPYKGSLPTAVPTDPLIYRWYEIVSVYGTTIKELIHEEFGDGIMSAIDFSHGHHARGRPQGRPRERGAVGQVPAVQDVLNARPSAFSASSIGPLSKSRRDTTTCLSAA